MWIAKRRTIQGVNSRFSQLIETANNIDFNPASFNSKTVVLSLVSSVLKLELHWFIGNSLDFLDNKTLSICENKHASPCCL